MMFRVSVVKLSGHGALLEPKFLIRQYTLGFENSFPPDSFVHGKWVSVGDFRNEPWLFFWIEVTGKRTQ